jgi:hypothetical protein
MEKGRTGMGNTTGVTDRTKVMRQCGDCQLCCKLLPVHDNERPWDRNALHKKAGEKCRYQKFGKGCTVYGKYEMPKCCELWNCRWIVNELPDDMSRPDRCHYVVDVMPDFITMVINGKEHHVQAIQIWIDPSYPDAHKDPALRAWLAEQAEEGIVGIIRYNEKDAITVFAPAMSDDRQWHEVRSTSSQKQHSVIDILTALSK